MWMVIAASAAQAACTEHVSNLELHDLLGPADAAVTSLDATALDGAIAELRAALPCLVEVADRATIGHVDGLLAISAFVGGRTEEALDHFAAARSLGWTLPPDLSGTLRETWDASSARDDARRDLPEPTHPEWWAVDGAAARTAPAARPFLLQRVGAGDEVLEGWMVGAGAALPVRPAVAVVPPPPVSEAPPPRGHTSRGLLVGGLGAAVAGAGAAVGAALVERTYDQSTQPDAELGGLRTTNAILGYGAIGLLTAGGGLGAGAVIVGRW
ncbi:MAG: hypothetical protein H6738_18985 [Alphaproteobacteria bacterium]|nr:hypothetical protein [Alphaproteobacteria bacterium]MCB9698874.1 hypothetical protein [Alphaproteobacteria bacterium]